MKNSPALPASSGVIPGRRRNFALACITSVAVFSGLAVWEMSESSCTFDEGVHLVAGISALRYGDYQISPDNPPLARVLAALPLLFLKPAWPAEPARWDVDGWYDFSFRFLYQAGNDPDRILFASRAAAMGWGLLILLSAAALARQTFGDRGAMVTLCCAVFSPTLLAHSHLATPDLPAAALGFLSIVAFRRFLRRPTLPRALASGVLLGGALATKFTLLALGPVLLLLAVIHRASPAFRPVPSGAGSRARGACFAWVRRILPWGILLLSAYATLWGTYGFRYSSPSAPEERRIPSLASDETGLEGRVLATVARLHLLPESYLHGFRMIRHDSVRPATAYAFGRYSESGWWWYFPVALLLKSPLTSILLLAWAVLKQSAVGWGGWLRKEFLLLPPICFMILAMMQTLNVGVRHVLVVLPFLLVLVGAVASRRAAGGWRRSRVAVGILLATMAAECLIAAPFFLPFVNGGGLAFAPRSRLLADSNVDWGQDLAKLRDFVETRGIPRLKLGYFGAASPTHLGLRHQPLPAFNLYRHQEDHGPEGTSLEPGDWVAVSVTAYLGLYSDDRQFYARLLGTRKPAFTVGKSILIFRVE